MNEREAAEYIAFLSRGGVKPGLSRVRELLEAIGNPQESLRFIHIAGTNGKGSVLAYVSTILTRAGYRVGRFSSPAVESEREIVAVNGRPISKRAYLEGLTRLRKAIRERHPESEQLFGAWSAESGETGSSVDAGSELPSAFEVQVALALGYFREQRCEIAVIETGMGGLEDATNVIPPPEVCVLTRIGMDHMQFLGRTLPEIARTKAGICKPGSRVVAMRPESDEIADVIQSEARGRGADGVRWTEPSNALNLRCGLERQTFDYAGYRKLEIRLAGVYQIANAALAVDTVRALTETGSFPVTEEAIRTGLRETVWRGRFTVLAKKPILIADGAHNPDGAEALARSIETYFPNRRILYIMGVLRDKDIPGILGATAHYADQIFTVKPPGNPRAMGSVELAEEVARVHPRVTSADSVEEALELARLFAAPEDVILAFGSLSFLGRLMELAGNKPGQRRTNDPK